jgi:hypothetical protein
MQVIDVANHPVEFEIAGKTFKIKRLSLLDIYAVFEAEARKESISDITAIASQMTDSKERIQFSKEAMKELPRGKELEDLAQSRMDSIAGGIKMLYVALSELNEISYEEVKAMVNDNRDNPSVDAQIAAIVNYIIGSDAVVEEKVDPKDSKKTVINTEKKT